MRATGACRPPTGSQLDADVILAAQAQLLAEEVDVPVVVATMNACHLMQFVDGRGWQEIPPA